MGISKSNLQFINDIIDLKSGGFHNISKIRIFNEEKKEITKFYNQGENLFSLIEVNKLFNILYKNLKSEKSFKIKSFKEDKFKKTNFKEKYNLIINCEKNNFISREYFSKNFKKNYNSIAYTALLFHQNKKAHHNQPVD